ncbi:hypothetical protein Q7P35_003784 [Cladosporium inversicolor]
MSVLTAPLAGLLDQVRLQAVPTNLSHPLPPTQPQRPRACRCFYRSPQLYTHNHPQPIIRPSRSCKHEARFVVHPVSHEPLALAHLAINWFQPTDYNYTREQQAAIAEWQALWRNHLGRIFLPSYATEQLALLRRAYKIFNTIFFCRKLPSVCIDSGSLQDVPAGATPGWHEQRTAPTLSLARA